jgi:hypothetical protein
LFKRTALLYQTGVKKKSTEDILTILRNNFIDNYTNALYKKRPAPHRTFYS